MSACKIVAIVAAALPAVFTAAAQSQPVTLNSPNGAIEI